MFRCVIALAIALPLFAQTGMLFPIWQERKIGFIDRAGKVRVAPKYDSVDDFADGMARVSVGSLSGYIDAEGRERVAPAYSVARDFSSGRALVMKDGKNLLIDRDGHVIAEIPYRPLGDFHAGLCRVQRPRSKDADGKTIPTAFGYIDLEGKVAIEPQFINAGDFPDDGGPAIVIDNHHFVYIDRAGKALFRLPISAADRAERIREGLVRWKEDGWWGYRNARGEWVIKPQFDSANDFEYGRASVQRKGKWILIDHKGQEVAPPKYLQAKPHSEGLAVAKGEGGRLGYVDTRGKWMFDDLPMLQEAHSFSGGLARVKMDGRFGFLDKAGKFALRPQFPEATDFKNGLARVMFEGGTVGYIDAQGNKVWESAVTTRRQ